MPIGNSQYGISRRQENIPTKCETIPQLTRTQNSAVRHEQYTQKFMANPEPIQLLFLPQSVNTETSIPTSQPTLKLDMIFGTQTGAVKHSSKWCVPSHLVEQFQKHRHRCENNFYL